MSRPTSAIITSASRRPTPGIVMIKSNMLVCARSSTSTCWEVSAIRGLEEVDMGEHLRDQQAVVLKAEAMSQRLAQRRDLGAQPAFGQLGQHRRIVLSGQQCAQDRPASLA
jgi:hypothetical protein